MEAPDGPVRAGASGIRQGGEGKTLARLAANVFAAVVVLAVLGQSAAAVVGQGGDAPPPLPAVNLHPAHLALPQPGAAWGHGPGVELRAGYGSMASVDVGSRAGAILDMEVGRVSLEWTGRFGSATAVGVSVPWVWLTRGAFDGFLNDYHDALGLPGGDRTHLPENELTYVVVSRGRTYDPDPPAGGGVGDVDLCVSFTLLPAGAHGWSAVGRGSVQLPTGDTGDGHGSGSVDLTGGGAVAWRGERVSLSGSLDLVYVGGSAHPALHLATHAAAQAAAGGSFRLGRETWASGQLTWYASPYDTGVRMFDRDVLMLALGLQGRWGARGRWSLGFTEDLITESSPDIAVFLSLAWHTGPPAQPH